ncbi:hypothetical protein, conserved [Thermococcus kodakarensis KOD1]|uniref:Uncharacterized protein n=1 Tax=Thermococcus kodakarensis (strain ATCC BAA-918 / JCM 12380 / KOD1) TaxID=69014 RepID=Q5JD80_THEKO|nr:hypothetical protein [Thermococcus kodakarensis]WCN28547.1 hypothetical protein POG15_02500 [Thermococcus kodakarensis]WCN30844.1 hypothetical protein POG21_02500 [Thermococcus kodakarensis]BAD84677.1 hypothetical protein, conserved [Thermococcus kodakarensis KOD1]
MNTLKLSGKHIYIEADLGKFYGGAYPFPLIMLLDDHVIVGMCWKKWSSGKLVGSPGDPYGVVQDLLDSVRFFMVAKPRRLVGVKPDTVREYGFQVGEDSSIYSATSVADSVFIFLERKNDVVKIHYYNQLLYETDCPEFKGMGRGTIELPFLEFVNDVLEISEGYLKNYAGVIERIMREYEEEPYDHDILWRWYLEIKEEITGRRI